MSRRNPPAKWILPEVIDPEERLCFQIEVPNDPMHIAAFRGALYNLTSARFWQDDPDHKALEVAAVWQDIWDEISMSCCPCPSSKIVDGVPMYTIDGQHYYPYPGAMNDPAVGGYGHWPPSKVPEGESGKCLAATNIASIYKSSTQTFLDLLAIDAAIGDLIGAATTAFAIFIEPVVILAWIVDFVAGMLDATFVALEDAANDTNVEKIKCAIDCNIDSDGTISHAQFEAIADSVTADPGGAIGLYMLSFLYGLGPVGLERMENVGIKDGDCDACDCSFVTLCIFSGQGSPSETNITSGDLVTITAVLGSRYASTFAFSQYVNIEVISYAGWTYDGEPLAVTWGYIPEIADSTGCEPITDPFLYFYGGDTGFQTFNGHASGFALAGSTPYDLVIKVTEI